MLLRVMRADRVRCSSRCTSSIRYAVLFTSFDKRYGLSSFLDAIIPTCFHESLWYLQRKVNRSDDSTLQTRSFVDCQTLLVDAYVFLNALSLLVYRAQAGIISMASHMAGLRIDAMITGARLCILVVSIQELSGEVTCRSSEQARDETVHRSTLLCCQTQAKHSRVAKSIAHRIACHGTKNKLLILARATLLGDGYLIIMYSNVRRHDTKNAVVATGLNKISCKQVRDVYCTVHPSM